jgi:tRNA(Ile)-lysidine synthase
MENSRTPHKAPDALIEALQLALAPWIKRSQQLRPAAPHPSGEAPIALALSGGLDSSVLLNATAALLRPLDIPLLAIHINHGLSVNAAEWARFCRIRCEVLGVQFVEVTVEVPQQASLEAAAREVRYQALAAKAKEHGAAVLLTAHHANDQAETVLLNLLRGSGVSGLRGIAAERQLGSLVLLRPWIDMERAALLDYAKRQRLSWVEDESNNNPRFRRNALRLQVMPTLVDFNYDAVERLGSLARHAAASAELLDALAAIDLTATLEDGGLAVPRLAVLGRARSANLLRYWLKHEGYGVPSENALHEWLDQLLSGSDTLELELAGQQFALDASVLKPVSLVREAFVPPRELPIHWQGEPQLEIPDWHGALCFDMVDGPGVSLQRMQQEPLSLRQRVGGERMQIASHAPSRTLKNLYQEQGINAVDRQSLPLMYCGEQLLFAAGIGMNLRQCETGGPCVLLRWVPAP